MNGKTRKKIYQFLVERDGEHCKFCGVSGKEKQLVVDHKDNNNNNNHPANHQLSCRRCNYLKNPRRPLDLSERNAEDESELQKSTRLRPLVREFIFHEVNELNEVAVKELLDAGAEEFSCSQITINRILDAMCSSRGVLERIPRGRTYIIRYKTSPPGI